MVWHNLVLFALYLFCCVFFCVALILRLVVDFGWLLFIFVNGFDDFRFCVLIVVVLVFALMWFECLLVLVNAIWCFGYLGTWTCRDDFWNCWFVGCFWVTCFVFVGCWLGELLLCGLRWVLLLFLVVGVWGWVLDLFGCLCLDVGFELWGWWALLWLVWYTACLFWFGLLRNWLCCFV